ncbi:MAPEG family protein [Hansschlegelia quercus]|uniref:Glutathione S-transferase n=1 Tax=Hansschlegelia quercus TaxID=2528245 RepID=A0A4Q9GKB8_9HYPH|nr:MAPEG family protein [Hansschlegelia quercus]TBN54628.1 glutathione S-transferase [Hansschlegelia quercus]
MTFPAITAAYASILALFYVGLAGWVIAGRVGHDTLFGDGGDQGLSKRIRSHGNFQEYVPFALIVVALYEASGGSHALVHGLLVVLLIARALHPIGMFAPVNSPRQFACRGGGILATLLVLAVGAIALLIRLT